MVKAVYCDHSIQPKCFRTISEVTLNLLKNDENYSYCYNSVNLKYQNQSQTDQIKVLKDFLAL